MAVDVVVGMNDSITDNIVLLLLFVIITFIVISTITKIVLILFMLHSTAIFLHQTQQYCSQADRSYNKCCIYNEFSKGNNLKQSISRLQLL